MIRVAASFVLLAFAGSTAAPCQATDMNDANSDRTVTVSITKTGGTEALLLKGRESRIIARSLTLSDNGKSLRLTPYGNGIELKFGNHIIRATELQFQTMPPIETIDAIKIQIEAKRHSLDRGAEQ